MYLIIEIPLILSAYTSGQVAAFKYCVNEVLAEYMEYSGRVPIEITTYHASYFTRIIAEFDIELYQAIGSLLYQKDIVSRRSGTLRSRAYFIRQAIVSRYESNVHGSTAMRTAHEPQAQSEKTRYQLTFFEKLKEFLVFWFVGSVSAFVLTYAAGLANLIWLGLMRTVVVAVFTGIVVGVVRIIQLRRLAC